MQMETKKKKLEQQYLYQKKIDSEIKAVIRDKGHYIMIQGSAQDDITIVNICAHDIEAPQYIKQIADTLYIEGEINSITVSGGH